MKRKLFILCPLIIIIVLFTIVWIIGGSLLAAHNFSVGKPPLDLNAVNVEFKSESGATVRGWFIQGREKAGAVILMHGVRSSRLDLIGRARFLSRAGYTVLLFDFQAHGESKGEHITLGYLESRDACAAVNFLKEAAPNEKIGVIGISMGGAAALLAHPPLEANALVLEEVYTTVEDATANRLAERFGGWAKFLSPCLTYQIRPRLGFSAGELCPIKKVKDNKSPKLFIVGAQDKYTTLEESKALFDAARGEKEFWSIDGAGHIDLHAFAKEEYEQRVLSFFEKHLRN